MPVCVVDPFYKEENRFLRDNYCGIALLSILSKGFAKAILNHLRPMVKALLRENQCDFHCNRSCADQIFSLRMLIEKAGDFRWPLYICFIDLRKAYDSVNWEAIWAALHQSEEASYPIRAYKTSHEFPIINGVCQGCVLASPFLTFTLTQLSIWLLMTIRRMGGRRGDNGVSTQCCIGREYKEVAAHHVDIRFWVHGLQSFNGELQGPLLQRAVRTWVLLPAMERHNWCALPSEFFVRPSPCNLFSDPLPSRWCPASNTWEVSCRSDCSCSLEVDARIAKVFKFFRSLSQVLRYQRRIKTSIKPCIFKSVTLPSLLCKYRKCRYRLPKQLLVWAPQGGNQAVGGQKLQWNDDLVLRDLKGCQLVNS